MLRNNPLEQVRSFGSQSHEDRSTVIPVLNPGDQAFAFQCVDPEAHASRGAKQAAHEIALTETKGRTVALQGCEDVERTARDAELFEFRFKSTVNILHNASGASDDADGAKVQFHALAFPLGKHSIDVVLGFHSRNIVCPI